MLKFLHLIYEHWAPIQRRSRFVRAYNHQGGYRHFLNDATDLHDLERRLRAAYLHSNGPSHYP